MIRLLVCVLVLLAVAGCRVTPDNEIELHLKDGRVVKGEVVSNDGKNIEVQADRVVVSVRVSQINFNYGMMFSEGMVAVRTGGKWGFIDTLGNLVVEPKFDETKIFNEGRAPVRIKNKWGFINVNGEVVIPLEYSDVDLFGEGLAPVKKWLNYSYIDTIGNKVIDDIYIYASKFYEGLAFVNHLGSVSYINKFGKVVIGSYDHGLMFGEGFAAVSSGDKWGFIDKRGELVIDMKFDDARYFSEGLAVASRKDADGCFKCGFINRHGDYVIEPQYEQCFIISEGYKILGHGGDIEVCLLAENDNDQESNSVQIVQLPEGGVGVIVDGKYGYVNIDGRLVLKPEYKGAFVYVNGYAMIENTGSVDYIDRGGLKVIQKLQ